MGVGEVGDGFEGLCFGDILEVDIMFFWRFDDSDVYVVRLILENRVNASSIRTIQKCLSVSFSCLKLVIAFTAWCRPIGNRLTPPI